MDDNISAFLSKKRKIDPHPAEAALDTPAAADTDSRGGQGSDEDDGAAAAGGEEVGGFNQPASLADFVQKNLMTGHERI